MGLAALPLSAVLAVNGWNSLRAFIEVGRSPAAALELEARGGELLAEGLLAALGALGERLVAHLLEILLLKAAGGALISVDRHVEVPERKVKS